MYFRNTEFDQSKVIFMLQYIFFRFQLSFAMGLQIWIEVWLISVFKGF